MSKEKILVVDDEKHILELISYNLISAGYKVIKAQNGIDAIKLAFDEMDLILLDIMLPEKDGYDVCREIRLSNEVRNIPIVMLTAKGEEFDKVLGLELGADDYVTKPFSVRELVARVKAILRRTSSSVDININKGTFGDLSVNFETREIMLKDVRIELTYKEYELLEILIKNKGKILTRESLLDKIWGYEFIGETRTVDVHIRYLRKKIEEDDKNPKFIETIRGVGYRFNPNI